MKNPTIPILLGAALLFGGYLFGMTASTTGDGIAHASPHWDAARGQYVTGDAMNLTFWKVKDGKVLEAHTVLRMGNHLVEATFPNSGKMPAPSSVPPAGSNDGASCGPGSCG